MTGFTGFFTGDSVSPSAPSELILEMMIQRLASVPNAGAGLHQSRRFFDPAGIAVGSCAPITGTKPKASLKWAVHDRQLLVFDSSITEQRELGESVLQDYREGNARPSLADSLLASIREDGLDAALRRLAGNFALAFWDGERRILNLARDAMGEKRVYYGWQAGSFLFSSELQTLRGHPSFSRKVDRDALALYFRYGYIPAPHSIYEGIHKLEPGTILQLTDENEQASPVRTSSFWSLHQVASAGLANPWAGSDAEAADELELRLKQAIALQRSDGHVTGAFLSGGIDSPLIAALLQQQSHVAVKTFTIAFEEASFDESDQARAIAAHLGTDHTEMLLTAVEAAALIEQLPLLYGEPSGDASAVSALLACFLASQQVSIVLSGDAGDELFYGYGRYQRAERIWSMVQRIPRAGRPLLAGVLSFLPAAAITKLLTSTTTAGEFSHLFATRAGSARNALLATSVEQVLREQVSAWKDPALLLNHVPSELVTVFTDASAHLTSGASEDRMAFMDTLTYLADGVLTKMDVAAAATGLVVKVPMLQHGVVEFAWSLPRRLKIRDGTGKWLLREVLQRHVLPVLVNRPKKGFGVPIGTWLRGPLRDWAEELLAEERLNNEGYLRSAVVRRYWREHLSEDYDWQYQLWPVLMFQVWLQAQRE